MTIFSKFRGFLSRHRNKFIIGGVLVSSTILLTKYAQQKLKEYQDQKTKEFLESSLKQQHFESTERTCNQTILNLANNLNEALQHEMNSEEIIKELKNNSNNKQELWNNLKVMVFSRVTAFVYLSVILVITLRVQLNILGAKLFKDPTLIPQNVQEEYLMLSQYLINNGIKDISNIIYEKIKEIVSEIDLKQQIGIEDLENTFWAIQTAITITDRNPLNKISTYVIEKEPTESGIYADMIRDTADILESDEVKSLVVHCINRGFGLLNDKMTDYYMAPKVANNKIMPECDKVKDVTNMTMTEKGAVPKSVNSEMNFLPPRTTKIPLAKLIPIINGLFAKNVLPDTLMQFLITNDKIRNLAANIYEGLG